MTGIQQDVSRGAREMTIAVSSRDTDSAYSVVECALAAGRSGPPLHVHPGSDEIFVVLSGTLLLHVDGVVVEAAADQVVTVPRGAVHTFATGPDAGAHFVTVHKPGGFEQFHVEASAAAQRAGRQLTVEELSDIARLHDWAPMGPPMLPTGALAGPS
jgi:mannose-6-phosphate isomerase-like protein (cupin superfamily)